MNDDEQAKIIIAAASGLVTIIGGWLGWMRDKYRLNRARTKLEETKTQLEEKKVVDTSEERKIQLVMLQYLWQRVADLEARLLEREHQSQIKEMKISELNERLETMSGKIKTIENGGTGHEAK